MPVRRIKEEAYIESMASGTVLVLAKGEACSSITRVLSAVREPSMRCVLSTAAWTAASVASPPPRHDPYAFSEPATQVVSVRDTRP